MKDFNFDEWWRIRGFCSMLQLFKTLYGKMIEWGFDQIGVNWTESRIYVSISTGTEEAKWFSFETICDFPRALKDAFRWMYQNRKNKPKEKCDKDGPCDLWVAYKGVYPGIFNYKYCPFCGTKR